ncbi:MAG: hypothetical protein ACOZIN_09335 [Myxococcota bacterium]
MTPRALLLFAAVTALCGCPKADPRPSDLDGGTGTNAAGFCEPAPVFSEDLSSCQSSADDYQPRVNASANDAWPPCISDDDFYHPINPSISTIGRVAAFEEIARKLWEGQRRPSAQDFVDARTLYAQDQGLDSRVQRREDIHYPAPPQPCSTAGVPEQYPDRCVGPQKLLPVLNEAFAQGSQGESPLVQAARIEAALLWFLYVSALSEATSCAVKPQDCDSSWAYYTGGTARWAPLGLSRYVHSLGSETHQRAYDGTLAVRCWRNLDNETGAAQDLVLRDRARNQLDRAMLRGIALITRARFSELACSKGEVLEARRAFLQTLVPFLDRSARERDAASADALKAALAAEDNPGAIAALDQLYPCP